MDTCGTALSKSRAALAQAGIAQFSARSLMQIVRTRMTLSTCRARVHEARFNATVRLLDVSRTWEFGACGCAVRSGSLPAVQSARNGSIGDFEAVRQGTLVARYSIEVENDGAAEANPSNDESVPGGAAIASGRAECERTARCDEPVSARITDELRAAAGLGAAGRRAG